MKNVWPREWFKSGYNYSLAGGTSYGRTFWRSSLAASLLLAVGGLIALGSTQIKIGHSSAYKPQLSATSSVAQALEPASPPATTAPSQDQDAALQTVLNGWVAAHQSQSWAVAVQGLSDDTRSASAGADMPYKSASIFKLLLTYSLFQKYSLDSLATTTVNVEGRGSVSLKDCVNLMLTVSDNACGEAVGDKIGWLRAANDLKKLGLNHTNLNVADGPVTTAGDTALYLQKLYTGGLYDTATQQYVIGLLQQQEYRAGIPTGCSGCTVADKTGDLDFVRHDAGIVQYNGGAYVLSIFTNGASYAQIAELTAQIQAQMTTR